MHRLERRLLLFRRRGFILLRLPRLEGRRNRLAVGPGVQLSGHQPGMDIPFGALGEGPEGRLSYDDPTSSFTCSTDSTGASKNTMSYKITFCPDSKTGI
mgnify:CR=1 FL=1